MVRARVYKHPIAKHIKQILVDITIQFRAQQVRTQIGNFCYEWKTTWGSDPAIPWVPPKTFAQGQALGMRLAPNFESEMDDDGCQTTSMTEQTIDLLRLTNVFVNLRKESSNADRLMNQGRSRKIRNITKHIPSAQVRLPFVPLWHFSWPWNQSIAKTDRKSIAKLDVLS